MSVINTMPISQKGKPNNSLKKRFTEFRKPLLRICAIMLNRRKYQETNVPRRGFYNPA